jgi:glycosyltransferase involved in cell wall biosynthesis
MLGDGLFKGRYNIGYWAWELERFPEAWREAIDIVDELWAPSKFIQGALRQMTDKPVVHMPLRVEPLPGATVDLQQFGVARGAFSYLLFFDFNSFTGRKNPMGVVNAFRDAFPRGDGRNVALIIKTIGAEQHPDAAEKLAALVRDDPRIQMIDETLPALAMAGLIEQAACFVSLHRSEGFGRGMAEAMAAGRIVIGTGYGGNMDFMSDETAYLVDYRLVPVGRNAYLHGEGAQWAEPDVAHAAQLMRHVFSERKEAVARAQAGQRLLNLRHSTAAVSENFRRRIHELAVLSRGPSSDEVASNRLAVAG